MIQIPIRREKKQSYHINRKADPRAKMITQITRRHTHHYQYPHLQLGSHVLGHDGVKVDLVITLGMRSVGRPNAGSSRLCESSSSAQVGVRSRNKDNLAVCRLGHGLIRLELADLHSRGRRQDVGRLAHEFGYFQLSVFLILSMVFRYFGTHQTRLPPLPQ